MSFAATGAAKGLDQVIGVLIISVMAGVLVVVFARTFAAARADRRRIRRCPVCHADALRDLRDERIDGTRTQMSLQCGECATWRRLVANHADFVWHVKALDRDRRLMCAQLEQLGVRGRQLITRDDPATAVGGAIRATTRAPTRRPRPH
jgi:hypothetical protein